MPQRTGLPVAPFQPGCCLIRPSCWLLRRRWYELVGDRDQLDPGMLTSCRSMVSHTPIACQGDERQPNFVSRRHP